MYKHTRMDFIETNLKPAMVENYESLMESLETMRVDFDKYRKRLKVVREEKERERLEFQGKTLLALHIHLYVLRYLFAKYSIKIVISFYIHRNEVLISFVYCREWWH